MHAEEYFLNASIKSVLREPSKKKLAIGTTCVRAIEHYMSKEDLNLKTNTRAEAQLFIRPPYDFKGVDYLLTNFHLPRSTLLCLVAAFLKPGSPDGLELLKKIYSEAIVHNYRFFSYGDAMLII
jgi:S-adenosylmethionine:tRNA ribosyltransferase-isomerase